MSIPYFQTIFEYPIAEFKRHLALENNERIFFSGRYGSGKTTFLKDYFKTPQASDQYEVYHLFPVNYSISANEDIIKYIKYDIIIAMLERGDDFAAESKSYIKTLPSFLLRRIDKVLASIIAMIPEVGKSVLDVYSRIEKLKDEYLAIHQAANEGPGDKLTSYLDSLQEQNGSLVENDIITRIIAGKIQSNSPKQSVLIMDDLDRLDPEHVFRILNVFAAHFDARNSNSGANKLGFDKVIIVCDIQNIRQIFHHRYGPLVDFTGYIDKFYSHDVYHFDNRIAIVKVIEQIIKSYSCTDGLEVMKHIYFNDEFLIEILEVLLRKGNVSLRSFFHTYGRTIHYHNEKVILNGRDEMFAWQFPMISKLRYLAELLGNGEHLTSILEIFKREEITLRYTQYNPGNCLYILHFNKINFEKDLAMINLDSNSYILSREHSSLNRRMYNYVTMHKVKRSGDGLEYSKGEEYAISEKNYWQLVIDTIKRLQALGYLK